MIKPPAIETNRLRIRPLQQSDAPSIHEAAGDWEIADTMISLPHPYPIGEAERYLARQKTELKEGCSVTFTIEKNPEEAFCGLIEIRAIEREHLQAELSFWLATKFWDRGYMTEAIQAVLPFAFTDLGLNRLYAHHMVRNPACGKVLEKIGFKKEGLLRERVRKWSKFEDVVLYTILKRDWRELEKSQ